jgi:hypothetical protein
MGIYPPTHGKILFHAPGYGDKPETCFYAKMVRLSSSSFPLLTSYDVVISLKRVWSFIICMIGRSVRKSIWGLECRLNRDLRTVPHEFSADSVNVSVLQEHLRLNGIMYWWADSHWRFHSFTDHQPSAWPAEEAEPDLPVHCPWLNRYTSVPLCYVSGYI